MSTTSAVPADPTSARTPIARPRRYLMCPPDFFDVTYSINPWMDPTRTVDVARARAQWDVLRRIYLDLGHQVDLIDPEPGLPDMVFAANGGVVVRGRALGARFHNAERAAEAPAYLKWFATELGDAVEPLNGCEGEGDFLVVGDTMLAGTGFRTEPAAHVEAARVLDIAVLPLRLVDPRFYHLDTALAVLDDHTVAYYPPAFAPESLELLRVTYPDAILAAESDAFVLGLNAVSDGLHVVMADQAVRLADQLRERGYEPVGVDLSELLAAGGGVKCCTQEVRP